MRNPKMFLYFDIDVYNIMAGHSSVVRILEISDRIE